MKVAYNRFWREKFNEEQAKSGKPRGTTCSVRLLKCRRPVAVLVNIALNSSYLSAGKNCSEILGQDIVIGDLLSNVRRRRPAAGNPVHLLTPHYATQRTSTIARRKKR